MMMRKSWYGGDMDDHVGTSMCSNRTEDFANGSGHNIGE